MLRLKANFTLEPVIGPAPNITLAVTNALLVNGVWIAVFNDAPLTISAAIQNAPGTDPNPTVLWSFGGLNAVSEFGANNSQMLISTTSANNILNAGQNINVTAAYPNATQCSVEVRIVPQLLDLAVLPSDYLFTSAAGQYFYNLSSFFGSVPANQSCVLEALTAPNTVTAWTHLCWWARDTGAQFFSYVNLHPVQGQGDNQRAFGLDRTRNVEVAATIIDSAEIMQQCVDVRNPGLYAVDLDNNLRISLESFSFAGAGQFGVVPDGVVDNASPLLRCSTSWRRGQPTEPQGYAAALAMALDDVVLRVESLPTDNVSVLVRARAVFLMHNGATSFIQNTAQNNQTISAASPLNILAGNIALGNVPNEVSHNDPLLFFWEVSQDSGLTWSALGVTDNEVFVTSLAPVPTTLNCLNSAVGPVYAYPTLLRISCHAADGLPGGGGDNVRDAIVNAFADGGLNVNLNMVRNSTPPLLLKYWGAAPVAQSLNQPAGLFGPSLFTSTNGHVSSKVWAQMLIAMWALHGIGRGRIICAKPKQPLVPPSSPPDSPPSIYHQKIGGFMVKNWAYTKPLPGNSGTACTNTLTVGPLNAAANQAMPGARIPAQNNAASPEAFQNHFIVRDGDGTMGNGNGLFYDPSYGTGAAERQAWIEKVVAGIFNDASPLSGPPVISLAGFVVSTGLDANEINAVPDSMVFYDPVAGIKVP